MTIPPVKAINSSLTQKENSSSAAKGKLQGAQLDKIEKAPSKLKILVHRILAIALMAISFAALTFGISLLASGTLFALGAASARLIGLFVATLGCSGLLRGISVMEETFSKPAKPEKKNEVATKKTPNESDNQAWVNFAKSLKQTVPGVYNFEKKGLTEIHDAFFNQTDAKALFLADNQIESIQDEIGNLVELQRLDVSKNKLKSLPKTIEALEKLEELSASSNSIESLPEEIGTLLQLKALRLSNNQLTQFPDSIGELSNLESLIAANNLLSCLPEGFGGLSKLVRLDLERNCITDLPDAVNDLVGLRELNLNRNSLGKADLDKLSHLQTLDLSNNQLIEFPKLYKAEDKKAPESCLESLNLSKNKIKAIPDDIDQHKEISELDLSDNALETLPVNLGKLPKLSILNISGNPSKAKISQELADLLVNRKAIGDENEPKKLKIIISPEQKAFLPFKLTASTNIDIVVLPPKVNLDGQKLKELPADLFEKTSLEHLSADNNSIESIPEDIQKLTNLTRLSLVNNKLTTLPEGLKELIKLTNLNVAGNQLSALPEIIFLENLKLLNISNNKFEILPDFILNLDALETLNISGNPLKSIPDLSQCSKLKTLYISKGQEQLITDKIRAKVRVIVGN
jgi:Leucine-rich repeat (LRR) protein